MCTRTRGDRPRFIHADLLIHPSGTHICYSNNGSTDIGGNISKQGTPFAGSTGSEMAHLFYSTLNNKGYCDPASAYSCSSQAGYGLVNTSPFSNFLSDTYWSAEYAWNPNWAWVFSSNSDTQNYDEKLISSIHALAVSLGDVAPVESAPDQQVFMANICNGCSWPRLCKNVSKFWKGKDNPSKSHHIQRSPPREGSGDPGKHAKLIFRDVFTQPGPNAA